MDWLWTAAALLQLSVPQPAVETFRTVHSQQQAAEIKAAAGCHSPRILRPGIDTGIRVCDPARHSEALFLVSFRCVNHSDYSFVHVTGTLLTSLDQFRREVLQEQLQVFAPHPFPDPMDAAAGIKRSYPESNACRELICHRAKS